MLRRMVIFALALSFPLAAACNKAPAQAAVAAAEKAVQTVRPTVEAYAPQELQALTEALRSAKAKLDGGDYAAALAEAQQVPAKADAAAKAALAVKEALTKEWGTIAAAVPPMLQAIGAKVEELAKAKKLPKGMDKQAVEDLKANAESLGELWKDAERVSGGGNVKEALAKAKEVQTKAQELMGTLGLAIDSPPTPAPAV
jgi:hypothetical protein